MGFLNPLFLIAGVAVAIPLLLHLLHRQEGQRIVFPALRYLLRTERDHARRIRTRQVLLLLARASIVLLIAVAGARLFVRGRGASHPPTALVVVLDNSLSSGRIVGDERVLDRLAALAVRSVTSASSADRIWVLRAGEPWEVVGPGSPTEARERIRETDVSAAFGDLTETLARASALIDGAGLGAGEIHLLSDLQASAFGDGPVVGVDVPVVVYSGLPEPEPNRYLREVRVGGGLPPRADRRTEVALDLGGTPGDTGSVTVRLLLEGRVRGAAEVQPGAAAVLPIGPFPPGSVSGYGESDPDGLRGDDRRYVAFTVRPPPGVGVAGEPGPFLTEALGVLEEGGRIQRVASAVAEVLIAKAGAGLLEGGGDLRVVIPPTDPAVLPALNRRLVDAGLPWRYGALDTSGEVGVARSSAPVSLEGVRIAARYRLVYEPGSRSRDDTLAVLTNGEPWMVATRVAEQAFLLLGSPLDETSSTLPVDASMIPLLEWILTGWGAAGEATRVQAGEALSLPATATEVELPDGSRVRTDGARSLRATAQTGLYRVLEGETVLDRVAINAPVRESLLEPLSASELESRLGPSTVAVDDDGAWEREIFVGRSGREPWRLLLATVLLLMVLEGWMASAGPMAGSDAESGAESGAKAGRGHARVA